MQLSDTKTSKRYLKAVFFVPISVNLSALVQQLRQLADNGPDWKAEPRLRHTLLAAGAVQT